MSTFLSLIFYAFEREFLLACEKAMSTLVPAILVPWNNETALGDFEAIRN